MTVACLSETKGTTQVYGNMDLNKLFQYNLIEIHACFIMICPFLWFFWITTQMCILQKKTICAFYCFPWISWSILTRWQKSSGVIVTVLIMTSTLVFMPCVLFAHNSTAKQVAKVFLFCKSENWSSKTHSDWAMFPWLAQGTMTASRYIYPSQQLCFSHSVAFHELHHEHLSSGFW